MKALWKIILAIGIVSYFLACAPVQFSKVPAPLCNGTGLNCVTSCNGKDCYDLMEDNKMVGEGIVDILIVNDNSGSMSTEQAAMGSKFPNFIQSLGNIDYRIAMTTTDISSNVSNSKNNYAGSANGNGKLQDGALIPFGSGIPYLTKSTPDAVNLFSKTVSRDETRVCEQNNYATGSCPSGDERGIFAANLAIDRNDSGFLRPNAPLAIIILADEDVRSGLYTGGPANSSGSSLGFELQDYDRSETLVARFQAKYPTKTLSVHSIVVPEGDDACLTAQRNQGNGNPYVRGSYGRLYSQLSQQTGGLVRSICSNDYGHELGEIAYAIQGQVPSLSFSCDPVEFDIDEDGKLEMFKVTLTPEPAQDVNAIADFSRRIVEFDRALPANTKINFKYACEKLKN